MFSSLHSKKNPECGSAQRIWFISIRDINSYLDRDNMIIIIKMIRFGSSFSYNQREKQNIYHKYVFVGGLGVLKSNEEYLVLGYIFKNTKP